MSRGDIERFGAPQDLIANSWIEELWRHHVHAPAVQQLRELALDRDEVESRNVARLELDEHVYVAVRAEVVPKNRAKQCQPPDVIASTERRHGFTID